MPWNKDGTRKKSSSYKMKGSPHKLGTIEGTSAHKASMAKFTVEQTRTSGDPSLVGTGSELGSSYIPHAQDYSIKTGFKIKDKEEEEEKKNGKKKGKKYDPRGKHKMDPHQLKDKPIITDKPDKGKKEIKINKKKSADYSYK